VDETTTGDKEALLIDKLDFLVRFWELSARHATLGHPLVAAEQLELLSLMQLVNADAQVPPVERADPVDDALPAQLIGEGSILTVEMRDVTASGVRVVSADTMQVGTHVVLRTADAVSGVEYVLPCTVAWVLRGAPNTMALTVDGIPSRTNFFSPVDAHARGSFAMGRHQRLVG
jgi:hypothetical protein